MKIDSIRIGNFRCFGPDATEFSLQGSLTTFVGNNGSGKTALFAALSKLFGVTQPQRAIHKRDFHIPLDAVELANGTMISIECVFSFPELDAEDADDSAIPDFFHHMAASGEDDPLKVRIRLQAVWTDDGTPEGTIEEEARWIPTLGNDFVWDECRKVQPVERGSIQLIYVPASRNASDQVTSLLKGRLWRAARWSTDLARTATEGAEAIQNQFEAEEPTQFITDRLERRWGDLHRGNTDAKPMLRLVESQIGELVKRAEFVFFPDETERTRSVEDLSDGQRSLFHIALTAATLEIEKDALAEAAEDCAFDQEKLRRVHLTILAIEEPENSLSPFFLSRIMTQARGIGGMEGAQVVVSSHSASILARTEADEVRYCRLEEETREARVRALTLPAAATDEGKYVRLAVKAYPELYFARFAILAEGASESIVIPRIAEAMNVPLDPSFVPIVPLGGRFVTHFWRLLNDLDIPYATLLDLDLGRKHGGAKAIKYAVEQLAEIGNDLSGNKLIIDGEIDLDEIDEIDDAELLSEDQDHPWLKALRRESVYFSSPIDLDFSMLRLFSAAYQKPREGGYGPRTSAAAVAEKKSVTLKTGGNPDLYPAEWDDEFAWYPYLFLSDSKPESHLRALTEIDSEQLASDAPEELCRLITRVKKKLAL
ncbi:AAA family ATPase [Roseomonas sp. E05]|uniref:ATP-dependent nuclease n=1 Tax=Roseomonas sp. E05 TaxID=3046310 RepID=UPI0024B880CB|nr:AAA family ATPase [Roseomonas sp. E05]MDJ0387334.1 AAA family ATPase [Roseomonas sp. E05]